MKKILIGLYFFSSTIFFIGLGFNLLNRESLLAKFLGAANIILFGGLLSYGAYNKIKSAKS